MQTKDLERLIPLLRKNGVTYFKNQDLVIRISVPCGTSVQKSTKSPQSLKDTEVIPPQAAPPVDVTIPHHVNEVKQLLKLTDEDLVDRLFPDYTQVEAD